MKPISLPLAADLRRCLAHGNQPGEWCERRSDCARHETIRHDGPESTGIPVVYRMCETELFAAHLPLQGFPDRDEENITYRIISKQPAQPGATTPGAGGANISVSQASEFLVEDGPRAPTSAEGLAVVEQPKPAKAPAEACSNEIPPPHYDPRSVSFSASQRRIANLEAILGNAEDVIDALQGDLRAAYARIALLEANMSLPLDHGSPGIKESLTAVDILTAAADHMAARASTYDKPSGERSMGKTVAMFNACTARDLSEAEGWLLLQCLKDVRLFQRPGYHADSAEDCTAYSALKAEAKAREAA